MGGERGVSDMRTDVIREGETLDRLSARLGLPGCMLLRANGLYSPAWLLPGREIRVPEPGWCAGRQGFICPVRALRLPCRPPGFRGQTRTIHARWGEGWPELAQRCGAGAEALMRLNRYWGEPLPGMRLNIPIE